MTKKNKTILGVVGGVLVIGGIGAATGVGDEKNNSSAYISSSVVESSVTSVQSTDNSLALSSSAYISSSIEESSVTSVQSTDISSVLSSSATSQPEISDLENPNSSTGEPVSSVSSAEPPQASIPSTPSTTTSTTTSTLPNNVSTTVPSTPQYKPSVVYIAATGNGKKYHKDPNCSQMNGNVIEMTRDEAEAAGYSPCQKSKCYGSHF